MGQEKDLKETIVSYLKNQNVLEVGFFGSFVRQESSSDSDIDVLVQYQRGTTLLDVIRLQKELEKKTDRTIDLVDKGAILPSTMKEIEKDLEIVYRDEKQPDLS